MGSKRKYSKKEWKVIRKEIAIKNLAGYRKRNHELRELNDSPKEENDQVNSDLERTVSLEDVLQIKVEESEITGGVDEDYSTILIDHSYSAIAVKAEPDDCVQYVPRLWPLYEADVYRFSTSETVASQITDDQDSLKANFTESENKGVHVKNELPSDEESEVEYLELHHARQSQTKSNYITNEIVDNRNKELNGNVDFDLVETARHKGGNINQGNELVDADSIGCNVQNAVTWRYPLRRIENGSSKSEYLSTSSETQTEVQDGGTDSTGISRRYHLRVQNHLDLARSNITDNFDAQHGDRNDDASFKDPSVRYKIESKSFEAIRTSEISGEFVDSGNADCGNENETLSSTSLKISNLVVKNPVREETWTSNVPVLHNQHINKLIELTNSIAKNFFESKIENKDDADKLLRSVDLSGKRTSSVESQNIAVTPLNIIREHSYVINSGGDVLNSTSFDGAAFERQNRSIRVKTQDELNASINLNENSASNVSAPKTKIASSAKDKTGKNGVRKRSRNKVHKSRNKRMLEGQYKFQIVRIMHKLSEEKLEMIRNSKFLVKKKLNKQSTYRTQNHKNSTPNPSEPSVTNAFPPLNVQSIENGLTTTVRNDLFDVKNETRDESLNQKTVENELAGVKDQIKSDPIITGRPVQIKSPNTRNAIQNKLSTVENSFRNETFTTKRQSSNESASQDVVQNPAANALPDPDSQVRNRSYLGEESLECPNNQAHSGSVNATTSVQNGSTDWQDRQGEDTSLELPGHFQSEMSLRVDKIIRGLFDEDDGGKHEEGLNLQYSHEKRPQNLSTGTLDPVGNQVQSNVEDTQRETVKDVSGSSIGRELFQATLAEGYDILGDPIQCESRYLRGEIQKESTKVTSQSRSKSCETSEMDCDARNQSLTAQKNQIQNRSLQVRSEIERDVSLRSIDGVSGSLAKDHDGYNEFANVETNLEVCNFTNAEEGIGGDCDKGTLQEQQQQLSGDKTGIDSVQTADMRSSTDSQFSKHYKEVAVNPDNRPLEIHLIEEKVEELTEFSKPSPIKNHSSEKIKTRNHDIILRKKKQVKCATCSKTLKPRALYFHSLNCSTKISKKYPKIPASEIEFVDLNRLLSELRAEFSAKTWTELLKCSIKTMQDVNGRFVEILLISDYENRRSFDGVNDKWVGCSTKVPLKVIALSNCGNRWAFLTSKQEEGIELILKYRKEVGVPDGSPYVFQYPLFRKEIHMCSLEARNDYVLPVTFHVPEASASSKIDTVDTATPSLSSTSDTPSKFVPPSKSTKFDFGKRDFIKKSAKTEKGSYKCFRLKTNKSCGGKKKLQRVNVKDVIQCRKCKNYFLKNYFYGHRLRCTRTVTPRKKKPPKTKVEEFKMKNPQDFSYTFDSNCPVLQSPSGVKKYFCVFCKKTLTKLKRHIEAVHFNEKEVQEMMNYPEKSAQREHILYKLRTRGTFLFNMTSKYNGGQIIVSRRPNPTLKRTSEDFLPCPHCGNYLSKKTLHRHTKRCSEDGGSQRSVRRISLALVNYRHPKCNKIMAANIIPRLVHDGISDSVKTDDLIILFGNHLVHKHIATNGNYVRQSLRTVGKLLCALKRRNPRIKGLSSVFSPEHCELVIDAIMEVAGYDSETDRFKLFETAKKLGPNVRICGEIWSMECSKGKKFLDQKMAMQFLKKFSQMYKKDVYSKLPKRQPRLPTANLKRLFKFSQVGMLELAVELRKNFSKETWSELADCLLIHVRLLNNNVLQDGETLRVSDYLQRHGVDSYEKCTFYHTLDLLSDFPKNYVKVKLQGSAKVPLLLSQEFCGAADVLLENREDAGVPVENVYVFGCPGEKDGHFKTNDAECRLRSKCTRTKSNPNSHIGNSNPIGAKVTNQRRFSSSYFKYLTKAYAYHSHRMFELKKTLNANFADRVWIELTKEVLACIQLMNDKTFTEVVQFMLLDDYEKRQMFDPQEHLGGYSTLCEQCEFAGDFLKVNLQGTPVHLLLNLQICEAIDLLIRERSSANIHPKNPYVFACSGNKYDYYRTGGCIGSLRLPVTNGVGGILSLRARIISNLAENGSIGIELSKFLPESEVNVVNNTVKLFYRAQFKMIELKYKLEECFSNKNWSDLIRCLLTYVHLLNTQVPDDPEKLLIDDYNNRQPLDESDTENTYYSLDDLSDFPQNYVKVKMGESPSYLLLSLDFNEAVDVLLKNRNEAGVRADNPYVFGCRGDDGNFITTRRAMCHMARRCGIKCLKYSKAKKVGDRIELQEQFVEMKEISKAVPPHMDLKRSRTARTSKSSVRSSSPIKVEQFDSNHTAGRRRWTQGETDIATKHFTSFLKRGTLPRIAQCQEVISKNAELQSRTPEQLKAWVNNQIKKNKTLNCDSDERPSVKSIARVRWSNTEQDIVKASFRSHFESRTLPGAPECRRVISLHPELKARTPEQMRAWINNYNKKFGCHRKSSL